MKIRRENEGDYAVVREVIEAAFKDAEHTDHTEHNLVDRLRDSKSFIPELSLVAEIDDRVVGHILFTKIDIIYDDARFPSLALAPVSVLPEYQYQGIGGALIREAHDIARSLGYKSAVVMGHKDYYPRFGYMPCADYGITLPFDVPAEYCMAVELTDGGLERVTGIVQYDSAFE